MTEIFGSNIDVPSFGLGDLGGSFTGSLIWSAIAFVFIIIFTIVGYIIWDMRRYKWKIEVYENYGGGKNNWVRRYDRGRIVKMGTGGEQILYLKKAKEYKSAYGRKIDTKTIPFVIGQDGYWYNFALGDFDSARELLDIEPIDRDMRMMHVAIRRNIIDRYRKQSGWEKYGGWVMLGLTMLLFLIGAWFLIKQTGNQLTLITTSNADTLKTTKTVMQGNKDVLVALENILNQQGSGLAPA